MAKAPTKTPASRSSTNKAPAAPTTKPVEDPKPTTDPKPEDAPKDDDKPSPDAPAQTNEPGPTGESAEDAYNRGFSDGFSSALDNETGNDVETGGPVPPDPEYGGYTQATESTEHSRLEAIALALTTPVNQRKGGLQPMVDRIEKYLDELAPADRYPAAVFMREVAKNDAMDIANGRFVLIVNEALKVLNGSTGSVVDDSADDSEAAARRLSETFQQEDESEAERERVAAETLSEEQYHDPDSPEGAAARLGAL